MSGGYDEGYQACKCFWGTEPGTYLKLLASVLTSFSNLKVLDAGCGEGKNAAYLAEKGAIVDAVDVSTFALDNARAHWGHNPRIRWIQGDVRNISLAREHFDIVIAYGLLHCVSNEAEIAAVLSALQNATVPDGYNVVCSFNDRHQELSAHSGFRPCLRTHRFFLSAYSSWEIVAESDSDLIERHPHNNIAHSHSLTRILARKRSR